MNVEVGGRTQIMEAVSFDEADTSRKRVLATQPLGRSSARGARELFASPRSLDNADLDADGRADILWLGAAGDTVAWTMNGRSIKGSAQLLRDPNFRVLGTGDFNGDGRTDILWYNATAKHTVIWLMNGGSITGGATLPHDPNFVVIAAPDFNGDGKSDLLWYNAVTGEFISWLMDGVSAIAINPILTDTNFRVVALPDLNGDGKTDIVWYNPVSGQTIAWLMNGNSLAGGGQLLAHPTFRVIAAPDLNGDGRSDLIWSNPSTGETVAWLMNGLTLVGGTRLLADPNYVVIGTPDLNGDGAADILWYSASLGQTVAWLMNGITLTGGGPVLTDRSFQVVSMSDLNGDGRSDLTWYSESTGQTVTWLMNGVGILDASGLLTDRNYRLSQAPTAASSFARVFSECFDGTPELYNRFYCVAYAAAAVHGATSANANLLGAEAQDSNVGNAGSGQALTAVGTSRPGSSALQSAFRSAYNTCFAGTPLLYTQRYCSAYAAAVAVGTTPVLANRTAAAAAASNVGNVGTGQTVDAVGTPLLPASPPVTAGPVTPAPTVSLSAAATTISSGQQTTLRWTSTNSTACSWGSDFTLPAAGEAPTGVLRQTTRYILTCTGPGGTGSSEVTVNVTTASGVEPPVITQQLPSSTVVTAGQPATFTINQAVSGTFFFQWRRNGVDISGATSPTYVIPNVTSADNGARFSVRVSNSAGSVTSAETVLTVNSPTSVLAGRNWTAGQLLESNDFPVIARAQGIDDQGRATVVFLKSNGSRLALYATRGTPGSAPASASWSTPQIIDEAGGQILSSMTERNFRIEVSVAPNGNALAYWVSPGTCGSAGYNPNGACNVLVMARFLVASNQWQAPEIVTDMPPTERLGMVINNRGDVIGLIPGWVRSGASGYVPHIAIIWRSSGAAEFQRRTFSEVALTGITLAVLDQSGNMTMVSQAAQNNTTDIVAYRGTLSAGFGAQQVLDSRGSAATLRALNVGLNGQVTAAWTQNNGTQTALYGATLSAPGANWAVQEIGTPGEFFLDGMELTVDDTGNSLLVLRTSLWQVRHVAGSWQAMRALPTGTPDSSFLSCSHARNGNFLCVANRSSGIDGDSGMWFTYDASRDELIQRRVTTNPGTGFVLGLNAINGGLGLSAPLLSASGHGLVVMLNRYDLLPTPSAPAGDGRNVTNLWGAFLR